MSQQNDDTFAQLKSEHRKHDSYIVTFPCCVEFASDSLAIHVSCSVGVKYQDRATLSNLCSLKQESIHTCVI
jgi:hypothetical protein